MVSITLENANKNFGKTQVLKNINLDIKDKEFMVLVGPSGCGKSTTLNIIAGLEYLTDGTIQFGDHEVTELPPNDRKVAMVFQSYALYPHMDVSENMSFGLKLAKVKKDEIEKRVNNAAKILGLEELLDRKPKNLSGGQRQRVALGRAIVREPTVFLLDEPLSNLDAKLRVEMRKQIKKLHRQVKTTFVYVTHDQVEAMSMATRICIMDEGVIQQVGTPEDVYNRPANKFVGGFIGSPAMNFITTKVIEDGENKILKIGSNTYNLPKDISEKVSGYEEVILGIRPEHIRVEKSSFENSFQAENDVIEYLGADSLIFVDIDENISLVISREGKYDGEIGDQCFIAWDSTNIQIFDPHTNKNLLL